MSSSNNCCRLNKQNISKHQGKPSSFWMHDPKLIFKELALTKGDTFLDLGCGVGEYSIYASKIIGETGIVYALDRNETLVHGLKEKAKVQGLNNIHAVHTDITNTLPLDTHSVDVGLIATVLHALDMKTYGTLIFSEIRRVLKSTGRIVIVDCSKKDDSFGPPMSMRLSPEEIEDYAGQHGFKMTKLIDLGFNYMIQFDSK